jgi:hypothetical protein
MITQIESYIHQVHEPQLGRSLVMLHLQLACRIWLVAQLDADETQWVEAKKQV